MRVVAGALPLLGFVYMHVEHVYGWGFLAFCYLVGLVGFLGVHWAWSRFLMIWKRLPRRWRAGVIAASFAAALGGNFIVSHGKPDEAAYNIATCFFAVLALLLWGLYRIVSRVLDAIAAHFSKR